MILKNKKIIKIYIIILLYKIKTIKKIIINNTNNMQQKMNQNYNLKINKTYQNNKLKS